MNTFTFKEMLADQNWLSKLAIGTSVNLTALLVFLFNPLFLPLSVIMGGITNGYLLRVMRTYIKGSKELPEWDQFVDLMISGISWLAVTLFFQFGGLALLALFLTQGVASGSTFVASKGFTNWGITTFLSVYCYFVLTSFFTSILMANFAQEESMKSGFQWLKVSTRMLRAPGKFLFVWLAGLSLIFLASFLPGLTFIGLIISPFLTFLAQVVQARMIALVWRETAKPGEEPSDSPASAALSS